jgi:chromosome segregation and condensation protein ScpB
MPRTKLPDRRGAETIEFTHDNLTYVVTFTRWSNGTLAELFIDVAKPGVPMNLIAKDMATLASIALQHGVPTSEIMSALSQELDGTMLGPLGIVLALIEKTSL